MELLTKFYLKHNLTKFAYMTTFTWTVTQLLTETIAGEQNYVVIANYEVVGVDGVYTSSIQDSARFSTDKITPFIPYEDLTNTIVIGWIQSILGVDGVANYEESIQGQIDSQINPPVTPEVTPLPPDFYPAP
jgi:hypothetical protein